MKIKLLMILACVLGMNASAMAEGVMVADENTGIEELNPFAPGVEDLLVGFDEIYENEMGIPAVENGVELLMSASSCSRTDCAVYADVDKSSQTLSLYINGRYVARWPVSSGMSGYETPDFDRHFNGRIYDAFTSNKYPGGDYNGLGNMPYAMFISGGFAIHGTPQGNWRYLGRPASHGCVRIHPDNAHYLNRQLRAVGSRNSWVSIHN